MRPGTRGFLGAVALLVLLLPPAAASAKRNVYVTTQAGDTISTFAPDPATGTLTPAATAGQAAGQDPIAVAIRPDGKFLYVAAATDGAIRGYSVAVDGALTPLARTFPAGSSPVGLTATADGRYLYATNESSSDISGYSIAADGTLIPLPGSPYPGATSNVGIASSPDSGLVYVTKPGAGPNVFGFSIGANGALAPLPATPATAGSLPRAISFGPSGRFIYVADGPGDAVHGFAVSASGALGAVPGSPFAAPDVSGALAVSPDGTRLYAPATSAVGVTGFAIAADGSLGPLPGSPYPGGPSSIGAAVTPSGRYLYTSRGGPPPNVGGFSIAADGALAPVPGSPFSAGGMNPGFGSLAITPNQPPQASLRLTPSQPGVRERTRFNATTSTDSDGTVASYVIEFGDGKSKTGTDGTASHKYGKVGTYTATVTTTDDEGCSTAVVHTGQTAHCNGSASAVATKQVVVTDEAVDEPSVAGKARQRQKGKKIVVELKAGAREDVTVVASGALRIKGKAKKLALKRVSKSIKAKRRKTLKLKLKRSSANAKVFRALDADRVVRALLSVRLTDEAGNVAVVKPPIELR